MPQSPPYHGRPARAALLLSVPSACILLASAFARADTDPHLDRPTLKCLGVYWVVPDGDTATLSLGYRNPNQTNWNVGHPLFKVEPGKHVSEKYGSKLDVPANSTLFAGSVVDLQPDTIYELRLALDKPGEPTVLKTLTARTRPEPLADKDAPVRHVVPAAASDKSAPGDGSKDHPFQGLLAAQAAAKPGDVILLAAGVYEGVFDVNKSGEPGKPIVYRGVDPATAILDGQGKAARRPGRVVAASDAHDVWFENLTVRNGDWGIVAHDAARLVVRGCNITGCDYAIAATRNDRDRCQDFFIADNVITGPSTWPRTKGIENARGVQVTGAGHVVCHNRMRNFADAIDTYGSSRCEAIDFHNNEISEMTDDGVELDYSTRNVRVFDNRFTNVFQGISVQPVYGGPVYAFRNALYNVALEPFKIHNSPSGACFYHNTVVKKGPPMIVMTPERASRIVFRNNLFVGTNGQYAAEFSLPMRDCDLDYDGYSNGDYKLFLRWNNQRFATFDEMKAKAPIERHATLVDKATLFAAGVQPPADPKAQAAAQDLRPADRSGAIDAGTPLPGLNDRFAGKAPDLGAYEAGAALPHYGPRVR
jgi:hypothetical protein